MEIDSMSLVRRGNTSVVVVGFDMSFCQKESQVGACSTCVHLRFRLARRCVHLRWVAMTCAHFGRIKFARKSTQVFHRLATQTQVNATCWLMSNNLILVNELQHRTTLKLCFGVSFTCEEICKLVWPPNASLYASSLVGTCDYLQDRLARAFRA